MPYIEGWDPGEATGYVHGYFDERTAFYLTGISTFDQDQAFDQIEDRDMNVYKWAYPDAHPVVVETFVLRASNEFAADLTGVEIIGAMKYLRRPFIWQPRTDKAQVPDQVLKDNGLWHTPKMVGHKSARHINDSIIHILRYLAFDLKHEPTIRRYFASED